MNADIVRRLKKSFEDEWKAQSMPASDLLDCLDLPSTIRFRPSGNPHQDIQQICQLLTGLPAANLTLACSKDKRLIALIQTQGLIILADNLNFELNSQGRAEDLITLVKCLDFNGKLASTIALAKIQPETRPLQPEHAILEFASTPNEKGLIALRSLFRMLNPSIEIDI